MITKRDVICLKDVLGSIMTVQDFINDLERAIKDQKRFEEIIYNILKYHGFDDETISDLLHISVLGFLETTLDIFNDCP